MDSSNDESDAGNFHPDGVCPFVGVEKQGLDEDTFRAF